MIYKIMTDPMFNMQGAKCKIEEIKDKCFDYLFMRVVLDEVDTINLIIDIIKEDTQIDINEYGIKMDTSEDYYYNFEIDDDPDLTDTEKLYIKKLLTEQYGQDVLKDAINPVIKQKLNTEYYEIQYYNYNIDFSLTIDIPLEVFHKRNPICKHLSNIE